ncbi:MAG: (2Fe-2S)-binding protein [Paenibacillaceae bacterium]
MSINLIICRCEEVTQSELDEAIKNGACTSQELKMATRAGMGFCQGRVCRSLLEKLVGEQSDAIDTHPSKLTIHYPVRPIQLRNLIERDLK